jgi:hypothetical protein
VEDKLAKVDKLKAVADQLGATLPQLAIAWCANNPNVSTVIMGATKEAQVLPFSRLSPRPFYQSSVETPVQFIKLGEMQSGFRVMQPLLQGGLGRNDRKVAESAPGLQVYDAVKTCSPLLTCPAVHCRCVSCL